MTFSKNKLKYFILCTCVCLIVIVALTPFLLTWGVNTTYVKNKISDRLYQETDIRIQSSEFSLKLFPKPGIKLNHINIHPDPETSIEIDSIRLNLDLMALIQGKISLGEIIIHHPKIQLPSFKKKSADSLNHFSFSQYTKKINAGFNLLPDDQNSLDIIIQNASGEYFRHLDAIVSLNKNEKTIHINTTIKNFLFPQTLLSNPDFRKHLDIDAIAINQIQLQAQINSAAQSITGKCQLIKSAVTATNQKKLFENDSMNLSFSLSEKYQQIELEQMKMSYPGGLLGINFFSDIEEKKTSLIFSGKNILIKQAREMSSVMFKDIHVAQTLFNILLDGQIPQIEVSFKSDAIGTLLNENHLELAGIIQNGKVHIPRTPLIASDIDGTANIKNGVLDISATRGIINSSSIEKGSLTVDLLNYEQVPFKGEFNLDVDLSTLPETLISVLPDTLISKELLKVHHVKGQCKSILNLELKDGSQDVYVRVRTKNFPVTGQYERIPGDIVLNNISVEYKPNQITLNNVSGTINNTVFTNLYTTIGLGKTPYVNIHNGSGIIQLESAIPWLMSYPETQKTIAPVKDGAGKIFLSSIKLSGPVKKIKNWKYNISGKMDNINISTVKNKKQIHNLTCNYQISNKGAELEDIKALINSLDPLELYLPKEYLDSVRTPLELNNAHLKTTPKPSLFKGVLNFSNGPELKIELKGDTFASLKLNTVDIKDSEDSDARISFNTDKNKPVFNFQGRLITKSLYKLLKPRSFLKKKLWAITEGQPVTLYTDTDGTLNIITKNINLNSFLSDTRKESFFKDSRMLTEGLINFKAEKLKIKKLNFSDVESKMSFSENHTYIRIKKANLCGIKTGGYLNIKNKKAYASFPLEAKNQENIQSLLSCLFNENKFMDGPYSFSCNLFANDIEMENISNKLNGTFALNSNQGRIYKLTLLSRILSVLNVSTVFKGKVPSITQEGFAYKNIIIEAQIKDSVLHLTNAVIDGEDMTMIFSGTIDPVNDKINITCLVAPFKTLDLIVEKIPVINTILGGRLVSVPVKAEGKLSDPQVIPLHPSAVGEGIINMMSRILKSPVTLWEKMIKDDDKSPKE